MSTRKDKILGTVFGLALGDAFGAPYEGGTLERALWYFIGNSVGKNRWTDDTQMSINVIETLNLHGGIDQDDLAERFASSYRWSRGYGSGAARLLKRIKKGEDWKEANRSVFPDGSFGNGGAMRAPVIGAYFAHDTDKAIREKAMQSAEITHAHPLGKEGAAIIAQATALAYRNATPLEIANKLLDNRSGSEFKTKLEQIAKWLAANQSIETKHIKQELGNGISATESCATSVYIAIKHLDEEFSALLDTCIKVKGDVDTIAAMAGGIWGAKNGYSQLPKNLIERIEQKEYLISIATALSEKE